MTIMVTNLNGGEFGTGGDSVQAKFAEFPFWDVLTKPVLGGSLPCALQASNTL
jgi:hypothetical protein